MSDFWQWLLGNDRQRTYDRPSTLPWPSVQDVEAARSYKRQFGNPNEQMITGQQPLNPGDEQQAYRQPQGLLSDVVPRAQAARRVNGGLLGDSQTPLDQKTADQLYAGQIAAQRSPLGYLGYDANRISPTPADDAGKGFNAAGMYLPDKDRIWADMNIPDTPVHESMHRAFKMLYGMEGAPKPGWTEEMMVRALMLRHYGNIEMGAGSANDKQVNDARELLKNPNFAKQLDQFEQLANEEIARRNMAKGPM